MPASHQISWQDILVVEFEDVSDPYTGIIAKYSYFKIGHSMIPRHVIFGKQWILKYPNLYSDELELIERDFIENKPFQQEIESVFSLSGVKYGRIDFSIRPRDGAIQVWKINTNPLIIGSRNSVDPRRMQLQTLTMERLADAFLLLGPSKSDSSVKLATL